jgi:glycosyltransferase involved in cell wall biosynthesis
MRILQVNAFFSYMYGGTVRVVCDLSRALAKNGHEVTIYTTDEGPEHRLTERDKIDLDGVADIHYFRCSNNRLAHRMRLHFSRQMRLAIKHDLRDFDIVHLHELRTIPNAYVWHYSRKYGVPYIVEPDNQTPYILGNKAFKRTYDRIIGMRTLRDANSVIAISKEEQAYINSIAPRKSLSLIYSGMDLEQFEKTPRYGAFREAIGIEGTLILYLGRLNLSKGIHHLIPAFARLHKDLSDSTLVIAGAGDGCRRVLEKIVERQNIKDSVIFTGAVSEEQKLSVLTDADLFVHPVKFMGGVGIAPLEAILCGTPVVVTPECGEIIEEARCGYFVSYGDIEDLYQKMKYAISNVDENARMIKRGKEYISTHLDWQNIARKVERVYTKCTE